MFMLAHAVNDGFAWVIPPLLPAVREHFGILCRDGSFSHLFRAFEVGCRLRHPTSSCLVPTATLLAAGLIWSSAGMLIASLSTSYPMLIWVSAISGIGRATYHPLAMTMLSRTFPKDLLGVPSPSI